VDLLANFICTKSNISVKVTNTQNFAINYIQLNHKMH